MSRRASRSVHHMARSMSPQQHLLSPLRGMAERLSQELDATPWDQELAIALAENTGALSFQKLALQDEYGIHDVDGQWVIDWPDDKAGAELAEWRTELTWQAVEAGVLRAIHSLTVFFDAAGVSAETIAELGPALHGAVDEWRREEWWAA